MGLGQTILYIVVPVVVIIYLLISDTTGLNFSLKVNFIANFMAPLLAYTAISTLGLANLFSDTKNVMLEFFLIGLITFLIIYLVAVISMYKAAKDKMVGVGESKQSCQNYKISSALTHGLKIGFLGIVTFLVVGLNPILQKPFLKLSSKMGVEDPGKMAYGIIGFYMAFMSLSGTGLSYFPAIEEGCRMTDEEITDAFNKGYPTLNYLNYNAKIKADEKSVVGLSDTPKGMVYNKKTGNFELASAGIGGAVSKLPAKISVKVGDKLKAKQLIPVEKGQNIKKDEKIKVIIISQKDGFMTVLKTDGTNNECETATVKAQNINVNSAQKI